jgi:5-methylcytosine-specific restriction enzyme A
MAKGRPFRTSESLEAELHTRAQILPLLTAAGYAELKESVVKRGTSNSQFVEARSPSGKLIRIHVRLCWRRTGDRAGIKLYAAAQLRTRLVNESFEDTLNYLEKRSQSDAVTHYLFVQPDDGDFAFAAMVPRDELSKIWLEQRKVSSALIASGKMGNISKNHAENGSSPTLWLQDDRTAYSHEVADVFWNSPGVFSILGSPEGAGTEFSDAIYDLSEAGRDLGIKRTELRTGFRRDPKVRALVLLRAGGKCERTGCNNSRSFPGFLDVHHILGIWSSDRVWSCVALCPNCHREAHFGPDRVELNDALMRYAKRFQ